MASGRGSEAKRAITIKIHYAKRTANQNAGKETAINFRQKEKQQRSNNNNKNNNYSNNDGVSYMKNYCGCELLSTYLKLISGGERRAARDAGDLPRRLVDAGDDTTCRAQGLAIG